ncbi:hypothetical protein BDN72DRAFT_502961 [Pluteus cervinus]|uniref:Uncharacterized protein n=1 Tax=Pluteus cervinus TaxID=181527 RepID=A0ACD3AYH9_9AGAR|nr:hypothetical protein BDN72DRAFT_502961 [Pluteus cervinus]
MHHCSRTGVFMLSATFRASVARWLVLARHPCIIDLKTCRQSRSPSGMGVWAFWAQGKMLQPSSWTRYIPYFYFSTRDAHASRPILALTRTAPVKICRSSITVTLPRRVSL